MHPLAFVSAGTTAGLLVSLLLRFVWAHVAARDESGVWRRASAFNEVAYILSHCLFGAGLGVLYWLSWGLAGVVDVLWWQRGLMFGGLITSLFGGALWLLLRSLLRLPAMLVWCWLVELGLLSSVAGLYCAWQWQKII